MAEAHKIVIEPGRKLRRYWHDLWQYRELFYFLSWRDVLVRYKQAALGIAWSVLRPFLTLVVFTVVFGAVSKLPSDGVPYPILVCAAMLPWQFFANSITECSASLINNANMLTKIYFPRLIVPASAIIVSLVDFAISLAILALLMIWYRFVPRWQIVALPLFLLQAMLAAFGFGLWLAALTVKYRDFRYVVPFLVQLGLYISPVGFSTSVVPQRWRLLYSLNPMVGVIDGFRWAILGGHSPIYWPGYLLSLLLTASVVVYSVRYFQATEQQFADII